MSCPICKREADPKYRPFCSRRCADVDLGKWLSGSYAIPAEAVDEDDDDLNQPPAPPRQ
ncbi:DNA gyrase inhibitor YacG [Pseudorhodobacter sp. E13]|uniref:DNA gyrase inhibitor YacG n=1 Tax=Pseudorhodobacter sp. E13 TaxID=2487931 RepID=UPI000F8E4AF8|nr:DNA gyrase inhibitor YacG [Pseudorhodobacter sp. E13]RUS58494.1 DNA gyrase inhibitor YacG [Pseudorhodobacter sp. E13]